MLEDDYRDVIGKAMIGRGVGLDALIAEISVSKEAWDIFWHGDFSVDVARACAAVLRLGEDAMAAHPKYLPRPLALAGVKQLDLPFGPYRVNAWWLEAAGRSVLFDTGLSVEDLSAVIHGKPDNAFITHDHRDHVGGLELLGEMGITARGAAIEGLPSMVAGEAIDCGEMSISACNLDGHAVPALGYHVTGLELPVLVMGDALFAGSAGKCPSPARYQLALERLHAVLDPLPDETVLLPGHGPATTLGEERVSNPFL